MRTSHHFDSLAWNSRLHSWITRAPSIRTQPRPQRLLLVQNGGTEKPLAKAAENSTNRRVFCHVTHDEVAFSKVVSSVWRPCLFSAIRNRYSKKTKTFHRVCLTILTNFWSHSGSLGQGFLTAVILNKEKVLGTRLIRTSDLGQVYRSTDEKFEPKN